MPPTTQDDAIGFLSDPAAYGAGDAPVERIDTHISIVWLVGSRAYKLKRAVHYDYVDFSTIEQRRQACEAEVTLNQRTAPALYRRVLPVTREADGALALAGRGVPVDWLVEMDRFDQDTLFDRLADRHQLDLSLMRGLADAIARLHLEAERYRDRGGRDGMAWVVDGNALGFADPGASVLDAAACARLTADARDVLAHHADTLEARRLSGFVRRCHGDLRLRNICLIQGVPTVFDGVEFNDDISCIDVFYDLAFVLMDLWRRDLRQHANLLFNEYLTCTADLGALPVLPFFLSCRAAVRAKTSVSAAAAQSDVAERTALEMAGRQYLALMTDHRAIHWYHYDRVFVTASVHAERHEPEMVAFVKAHRQDLERLSAAFLSVNLFEAVAEDPNASPEHRAQAAADAQQMCDLFVRETGWHPSHILLVAGALAYRQYNLFVRFVMRRIARKAGIPADAKRDYDFTNWAAVDQFVRTVTDATQAREAVS